MKYILYSVKFASLLLIIMSTTTGIVAEENKTDTNDNSSISLSGKVVDTEGQPIPGFTFSIQSSTTPNIHINHTMVRMPELSTIRPIIDNNKDVTQINITKWKTDSEGTFSVSGIRPGYVSIDAISKEQFDERKKVDNKKKADEKKIEIIPPIPHQHVVFDVHNVNEELGMKIVSIRLNKITFYNPENISHFPGLMFGVKPGVDLKDVTITVKRSLKIRSQIVYKDGTPVANSHLNLVIYYHTAHFVGGSETDQKACKTDPNGFFTQSRGEPGLYSLKVNYEGFTGTVGPFLLDHGIHPSELVIRLNGNPVDDKSPKKTTTKLNQDKSRIFVRNLLNNNNRPNKIANIKSERLVWIINPANGHAYAKINCQDWKDAQRKAIDENAHLVSINDQEELFWVQTIFQDHYYWIGLNDVEEEGVWRWDSGEPVTYTNLTKNRFLTDNSPDSEKDYVAMLSYHSSWEAVGPQVLNWRWIQFAIIEKDGLVSKIPKSKDSTQE